MRFSEDVQLRFIYAGNFVCQGLLELKVSSSMNLSVFEYFVLREQPTSKLFDAMSGRVEARCSVLVVCIAASRNDYRRFTCYQLSRAARTANFLARQEVAPGTFSVLFRFLSLSPGRSIANQSTGHNDNRGYKERACRGLFRDPGNFDFRDARRIAITRKRSGWAAGKHDREI